ncbi:hypothetical protein D9M68_894310 [compost metagenome]
MLKNILSGIGSVLVIYPASGYASYHRTLEHDFRRTDLEALRSDVRAIGGDFHKAMDQGVARVAKEKDCA